MTSSGTRAAAEPQAQPPRAGRKTAAEPRRPASRVLVLPQTMSVKDLALLIDQTPIDVIKQLMRHGIMASMNQIIDYQVASLVTSAAGIRTKLAEPEQAAAPVKAAPAPESANLVTRPPVVTVMGHVDHGKTSLLDTIRKAQVASREVGGITQHIGAYQVEYDGKKITFLDTPGHEAFTAIRSRGAKATDIAVLVVAADDGIMPQTIEAIDHARAASVPIIVAINKMDLPDANPDRVKLQLNERGLVIEEWGGDVIAVPLSARTGQGIDDLLDNVLVVSEIADLKADPTKPASGVIIEAKLDRRRGPTATVLVQSGTLRVGDYIVAGTAWGRVKAMTNDQGQAIKEVTPGDPGEVLGFGSVPEAGDVLTVVTSERAARTIATDRERSKSVQQAQARALTLEEVVKQIDAGDVKELNLVLKADVQGSVEAVRQALEKLTDAEAKVRVLHAGSGAVTESDVMLASASNAIVIAFTVGNEPGVDRLADRSGVEIRHYNIIYQLIDDVERALHGMLEPTYTDVVVGRAEVREVFPGRGNTKVAGCRVLEGRLVRGAAVRVLRGQQVVKETSIAGLRHFREEVTQINTGMECGAMLQDFHEFEAGDILEAHRQERRAR
ncbi:MAG: translation initiation factor IF-2 [SAR202 cluster bacterium]|nr:translation initiation factor IF-2 [SAR202 cluster bacterium]